MSKISYANGDEIKNNPETIIHISSRSGPEQLLCPAQGGLADFAEARFATGATGGMHGAMADLLLLAHALSMDESGAWHLTPVA